MFGQPGDSSAMRAGEEVPHFAAYPCHQVQADRTPLQKFPQAHEDLPADVLLRSRAADGEGDGERAPLGEAAQAAGEVAAQGVQAPVAEDFEGKGKAGQGDPFGRNAVPAQAQAGPLAGDQVMDAAVARVFGDPGAAHLGIAEDAVDRRVAGPVGGDGRSRVGGHQGQRPGPDGLEHAPAQAPPELGLQEAHRERRPGKVAQRVVGRNGEQPVREAEGGAADEGDGFQPGGQLVGAAETAPEPGFPRAFPRSKHRA